MRNVTLLGAAAALALTACDGAITDPQIEQCLGVSPGPSPARRLTRLEYNNTVRDLLGDDTRPADSFAPEEEYYGFNNNAGSLTVSPLLAEQYMVAAEQLSERADVTALLPCDPAAAAGELACARELIETFGSRAYRRPLAADDVDRLLAVFQWGAAEHDFETGIQLAIQAMLQSPHFLYRVELASAGAPGEVVPLDDHEMASRLSYLLWQTMPDDALFAAAAAGELRTPAQVRAHAERMLADPRARAAVADFTRQWLQLDDIPRIEKDPVVFPELYPGLRDLLAAESEAFVEHVLWDGAGDVGTLLTADFTYMNAELAAFYGVDGPTGEAFERVELDPERAAGVLTHAGVLAAHAKPNQSSPIHRGKFVREQLLCDPLPPPPDNIVVVPPELDPDLSTRERFSQHATDPACSGCHRLMDPIGFGFEHFDGMGRWRDDENGIPVDASGELISTDSDGPFDGVPDLSRRLAGSDQVHACVVTQLFRHSYGRIETPEDACTLADLTQQFAASGHDIKTLLLDLTQTDAFLYRRVADGEVSP